MQNQRVRIGLDGFESLLVLLRVQEPGSERGSSGTEVTTENDFEIFGRHDVVERGREGEGGC